MKRKLINIFLTAAMIVNILPCITFAEGALEKINSASNLSEMKTAIEENYEELGIETFGAYNFLNNKNYILYELLNKNFTTAEDVKTIFDSSVSEHMDKTVYYPYIANSTKSSAADEEYIFNSGLSRFVDSFWTTATTETTQGNIAVFAFDTSELEIPDGYSAAFAFRDLRVGYTERGKETLGYKLRMHYSDEDQEWLANKTPYITDILASGEAYYGKWTYIDVTEALINRQKDNKTVFSFYNEQGGLNIVGTRNNQFQKPFLIVYKDNTFEEDETAALAKTVELPDWAVMNKKFDPLAFEYEIKIPEGNDIPELNVIPQNSEDEVKIDYPEDDDETITVEIIHCGGVVSKTYKFKIVEEVPVKITDTTINGNNIEFTAVNLKGAMNAKAVVQVLNDFKPEDIIITDITFSDKGVVSKSITANGLSSSSEVCIVIFETLPTADNMGKAVSGISISKQGYGNIALNKTLIEQGSKLRISRTSNTSAVMQIINSSGKLMVNTVIDDSKTILLPDEWEDGTYTVRVGNDNVFTAEEFEMREIGKSAELSSVLVGGKEIYVPGETEFTVEFEYGRDEIPQTVITAEDKMALVTETDSFPDTAVRCIKTVTVIAEDGTEKIYKIIYKWEITKEQQKIVDEVNSASSIDEMSALIYSYAEKMGISFDGDYKLVDNVRHIYAQMLGKKYTQYRDIKKAFDEAVESMLSQVKTDASGINATGYEKVLKDFHSISMSKTLKNFWTHKISSGASNVAAISVDISGIDGGNSLKELKFYIHDMYTEQSGSEYDVSLLGLYSPDDPDWIANKTEYTYKKIAENVPAICDGDLYIDCLDYVRECKERGDNTAVFVLLSYSIGSNYSGMDNGNNTPGLIAKYDNSAELDSKKALLTDIKVTGGQFGDITESGKLNYRVEVPYGIKKAPVIIPVFADEADKYTITENTLEKGAVINVRSADDTVIKKYTVSYDILPQCDIVKIEKRDEETSKVYIEVKDNVASDAERYAYIQLLNGNTPVSTAYAKLSGNNAEVDFGEKAEGFMSLDINAIITDREVKSGGVATVLSESMPYFAEKLTPDSSKSVADNGDALKIYEQSGLKTLICIFDNKGKLNYITAAQEAEIIVPDKWDAVYYTLETMHSAVNASKSLEIRELSANDSIQSINVSDESAVVEFDAQKENNTIIIPFGTTDVPVITVVTEDKNASFTITAPLTVPDTEYTVTVTAENGTKKTYTFIVKWSDNCSDLSELTVEGGILSPAFTRANTSYTARLSSGTDVPKVTAKAVDSRADVHIYSTSDNCTVTVTAVDNSKKIYTIKYQTNNTNTSAHSGGGGGRNTAVTPPTEVKPPETENKFPFSDVSEHWSKDYVNEAFNLGFVKGKSENAFAPEDYITRAEFTAIIVRMLNAETVEYDGSFTDVSKDDWFANDIASANKIGIISGYDGKAEPGRFITREEAAKIIAVAYEQRKEILYDEAIPDFSDVDDVSDWSKKYVAAVQQLGIINGMGDNTFRPKNNLTRAEAAAMIIKLYKKSL